MLHVVLLPCCFDNARHSLSLCLFVLMIFFQSSQISGESMKIDTRRDGETDSALEYRKAKNIIRILRKDYPDLQKGLIEFFHSPFGYTLIGEKPISFDEVALDQESICALSKIISEGSGFVCKTTLSCSGKTEICLIHKKSFFKLCREDSFVADFLKKKKLSAMGLLREFEKINFSFARFCGYDDAAIGAFLGFGSQNSILWSRWAKIGFFLGAWPFKQPSTKPSASMIVFPLPGVRAPEILDILKINESFPSLYAEWIFLNKHRRFVDDVPSPPFSIPLPGFFYWKGHEQPVQQYVQARITLGKVLEI